MQRLVTLGIAALMAAGVATEAAAARRPHVIITPYSRYDTEPGAIYGYAPGVYVPGPNGMLYGPYGRFRPRIQYGVGPDGYYGPGPAWYREEYRPGWFGWYGPSW
jgi:hypothetical protein